MQISFRFVIASADSIRAISLSGFVEEAECRSGKAWRSTSVTKWRSEARLTLGITRASRLGAWRTEVRSSSARPEETALMRTLSSLMCGGRGWERKSWMFFLAAGFWAGVTESSRS